MAVKKVVETVVGAAKTLPKALEANKAVEAAKSAEKQIAEIAKKPTITKADIKKIETLEKTIDKNLDKAKELGANVKSVEKAINKTVENAKQEIPTTKAPAAKAAPKAEEAPGPSNLPKSTTTKTPVKAAETKPTATKTPPKTTKAAKAADEEPAPIRGAKPATKLEEGAEPPVRPPFGVFPAIGGNIAGRGLDAGTPDGDKGDTTPPPGSNIVPPEDRPGGNDGNAGDSGDGGDTGAGNDGDGTTDQPPGKPPKKPVVPVDDDGEEPPVVVVPPPKNEPVEDKFATQWLILKAKLLAAGLPESTVDASVDYFRTIIKDARFSGPNELENVVDQYLYLPTYTSKAGTAVESPFYKDFGKFNDKLTTKKKPGELVGLVLGYKRVINKYVGSETARGLFTTDDSISKYMQNDVSVAELDERANAARLRSITADPYYVQSLKELGFISDASDLTSFFLDPNIGTKALEDRRTAGAFATEAVRRANEATGIKLDTEFARKQAARLTELGYSEAQITQLAGQGFENIAEQLKPTEKLSGIYESRLGTAASAKDIQQELQSEQFLGMASQRRKKLAEQEVQAFRGQSGISTTALRSGTMGIL